jgi:hypothetical protein
VGPRVGLGVKKERESKIWQLNTDVSAACPAAWSLYQLSYSGSMLTPGGKFAEEYPTTRLSAECSAEFCDDRRLKIGRRCERNYSRRNE